MTRLRQSSYTFRMNQLKLSHALLCLATMMLAAALPISGCSQKSASSTAQSVAAQMAATQTAANNELTLYQQLLAQQKRPQALLIAKDIIQKYPGTPAAAQVQKTLPELEAEAEHDKLAALWLYQTEDQDGLQYTAGIYSSQPSGLDNRVELILRPHVGWPQSVYLYGNGQGFVCQKVCSLVMRMDGNREVWKAYLPETGEPAMFIKDDKRFIAMLPKIKVIEMDVVTKDNGPETLTFEVGGYDPSKFLSLPKN